MSFADIENKLQKAVGLSAEPTKCFISLVFPTEDEAISAFESMLPILQPDELMIHIRYNQTMKLSLISKKTGDAINVDNLLYHPVATSYLDLISNTLNNKNHPERDYITLLCCVFKDGQMVAPKDNLIGLRNINKLTLEFVE
jgi:hypothetical protein